MKAKEVKENKSVKAEKEMPEVCCEANSGGLVGIAAILGGIIFLNVMFFLIFARDQLGLLIPITWAVVVLGLILGLLYYLSLKSKK